MAGPVSVPPASAPSARSGPWLYGPARDLLFGYGLAYIVSVPLLVAATSRSGGGEGPLWVAALFALVFSTPHYGATLLRVYESAEERRSHAFFTVWVTLLLVGLFVVGLHSPLVGSVLVTAYVTWGIWHFSAQNYGIAVMYLRRCGLEVRPGVKRPLYASFVLSALLAIVAIYVSGSGLSFAAGSEDASGTFRVLQLGVPGAVRSAMVAGATAGYLAALGLLVGRLWGRLSARRLVPLGLLVLTQALWYSVPAVGAFFGAWQSRATGYAFAAIWISTAHAVQYLWVSTYYAQRHGRCTRPAPYWTRCMLAGAAATSPALFLAPGLFGGVAIEGAAIVVLVFAVMNLHHFVLDGVIWRLRDGRLARLLVRSETDSPVAPAGGGWRWVRAVVFAVGALVVMQQLIGAWSARLVFTEGTPLAMRRAVAQELYWLGLDVPEVWLRLGTTAEEAGKRELAIRSYRRAVQMHADGPPPWVLSRLAWLLLERDDDPRSVRAATRLAVRLARALGDGSPAGYHALAAAHAAGGRWEQAIRAAERALEVSRVTGDRAQVPELRRSLAFYRARGGAPASGP